MAFAGKYEMESQENYNEFLEAIGFPQTKTAQSVVVEVLQDEKDFTWTQITPTHNWANKFTAGQECDLVTPNGTKFKAHVSLKEGKISVPFPQYQFTAEIIDDKLVMNCSTSGEKGVTLRRVCKRI